MTQYYLTERDRRLLRRLERLLDGRENLPSPRLPVDPEDETPQAPETYIALVPTGGIPAATPAMGTGTALEFSQGDQPGKATCEIYQIVSGELQSIEKTQEVYNLSSSSISQQWITIARDKFGRWIAQVSGKSCDSRNEIWKFKIAGSPTGGSFDVDITINSTQETITVNYDDTAAEVKTAIVTHSEITSSDIDTAGGPLPDSEVVIEFQGDLSNKQMFDSSVNSPVIDDSSLTGGAGPHAILQALIPGYPDNANG